MAGIGAFVFGYLEDYSGRKSDFVEHHFSYVGLSGPFSTRVIFLLQFIFGGNAIPDWFNAKNLFGWRLFLSVCFQTQSIGK